MSGGLAQVLAEGRTLRRSQLPVFMGVVGVHAVVGWALLSITAVREAVMEAVPVMIATMIESQPEPERYVPPPPASPDVRVVPQPLIVPLQLPVEAPVYEVPLATHLPPLPEAPTESEADAHVRMPAPAPPKTIPASAVEYVVLPKPAYPLYSRRARETGVVMLRVLINEKGMPVHIEVEKSSGYSRLDDAAVAAMQGARFKPYTEDGVALSVWAPAPIIFEL
jgi:periplasmic protein TonB